MGREGGRDRRGEGIEKMGKGREGKKEAEREGR